MSKELKFPEGFLWGASSASHQVEGNNKNDWSEWEKSNHRINKLHSEGLAEKYGIENYISDKATDHYNLYKEDFTIAKELGHNATRISIEWSRIEPEEGVFNEEEINHYKEVVKTLRLLNMEPFVTLWHWPMPLWLSKQGGWESKKTISYFKRYADKISKALGEDVKFWLTINEPEVYPPLSYLYDVWPPQKKNPISFLKVSWNLIKAHNEVYKIIKKNDPDSKISIAFNLESYEAVTLLDKFLVPIYSFVRNKVLINLTKKSLDFIGLNYYFHSRIYFGLKKNITEKKSDFGWDLHPEKIYDILMLLKKYNKPIYITENGLADADDVHREWFIIEVLTAIHKAISHGADVRGYLHWSLTDNFEWASGYWPRFGLVHINYETLERTIRPSARFYEKICKNNTLFSEDN